jgi:hypothetical protein
MRPWTYAGLKSTIYARLTVDDPKAKAAVCWLEMQYAWIAILG